MNETSAAVEDFHSYRLSILTVEMPRFKHVQRFVIPYLLHPHKISLVKTTVLTIHVVWDTRLTFGYFYRPSGKQNDLHVFITRATHDDGPPVVFLQFKLFIEDSLVRRHNTNDIISTAFRKGDTVYPYIQRDVENIFSIKFEILLTIDSRSDIMGDERDVDILSQNMNNLFENEILTDTVLNSRDQAVKLHKSVLWARFPYLLKHIDLDEKSKKLEIPQDTLKKFLRCMYSGYLADEDSCIPYDIFTNVETYDTASSDGSMREMTSKLHVHNRVNHCSTSFEFSIKNLHEWDSHEEMSSPSLNLGACQCRLIAQIIPFESLEFEGAEIVLRIQRVCAETLDPIYLSCKVITISAKGTRNFSSDCSISDGEQFTFRFLFFTQEDYMDRKLKIGPFPLTFKCIFTASDGCFSQSFFGMHLIQRHSLSDKKLLSFDLRKLLMNTEFSDVNLIVGENEFPAHKAILAARSPVFNKMFQTDMVENTTHRVTITDANPEVIAALLQYIYTAEVEVRSEMNVMELYAVADKYEVLDLRRECASYLMLTLNTEIVHDVIAVADMHSDKRLKTAAEKFKMAINRKK